MQCSQECRQCLDALDASTLNGQVRICALFAPALVLAFPFTCPIAAADIAFLHSIPVDMRSCRHFTDGHIPIDIVNARITFEPAHKDSAKSAVLHLMYGVNASHALTSKSQASAAIATPARS